MMMAANRWYIYYGRDGEVIPPGVTHVRIHESVTVIPAQAFYNNRTIEEVKCHDNVRTVEEIAFDSCPSLRIVIMPGVEVIGWGAFCCCETLRYVECDKLERIGYGAFDGCESLGSINLPSAKIIERSAFASCTALTNVKFGKELELIEQRAFYCCKSLERITLPLKDGIITADNTFQWCKKLVHVDLVEGEVLRDTIDALILDEWRNDMNVEIGVINQSLPNTPAGDGLFDVGGKAQAVQSWISSVLHKIVQYKAQHHSYLNESATTLQHALHQDIVLKNILPLLELPSYTFEGED